MTNSPIQDDILNILFDYSESNKIFKQWLYPLYPKAYDINPEVFKLIHAGIIGGFKAQEIADTIYKVKTS